MHDYQVQKLTIELKNTNLIKMKFSYKGGDNGRNIENPLIFKLFQSGVTTVRMQLN